MDTTKLDDEVGMDVAQFVDGLIEAACMSTRLTSGERMMMVNAFSLCITNAARLAFMHAGDVLRDTAHAVYNQHFPRESQVMHNARMSRVATLQQQAHVFLIPSKADVDKVVDMLITAVNAGDV